MGEVFRYVADTAIAAHRLEDTLCAICDSSTDVFYVCADAEVPGDGYGPITEACARCIRLFRPEQVSALDIEKRLPGYLRAAAPWMGKVELQFRQAAITDELRRTPRLPHFPQREDWPFCCGDIVEYTGEPSPPDAELLDQDGQYWDRGPAVFHDRAATLVPSRELAVIGGVSAFRCPRCSKRYWTFQCT